MHGEPEQRLSSSVFGVGKDRRNRHDRNGGCTITGETECVLVKNTQKNMMRESVSESCGCEKNRIRRKQGRSQSSRKKNKKDEKTMEKAPNAKQIANRKK